MVGGRLAGRIALVTGASRGLGAAIAKRFGAEGAELILLARTSGGLEEVDDAVREAGGHATLVPLDITDFAALDRLGAAIYERHKRLDILVANAAMLGTLSPLAHIDPKEWQKVIDVNLTANWRLIRSLDPLLRASPAGRAIFVTASSGKAPRAYWGAYALSKFALEGLSQVLAAELEGISHVRVNTLNPGRARTAMRRQAYPAEDLDTLPEPGRLAAAYLALLGPASRGITGACFDAQPLLEEVPSG